MLRTSIAKASLDKKLSAMLINMHYQKESIWESSKLETKQKQRQAYIIVVFSSNSTCFVTKYVLESNTPTALASKMNLEPERTV